MSRILIAGWPRVGKTFLAAQLAASSGARVLHTDDLIATHAWSEASRVASAWLEDPGPWICEGVAIPRAIRKFLERNASAPADLLYWSATPREDLTPGQITMGKGCDTVWAAVRDELVRRGTRIETF
jgi:adenylate kinase family enzyme